MLVCALLVHIAHETAGAARTRSSLRPLFGEGEMFKAKLARNARRDREGVFDAIRNCTLLVIPGRAKHEPGIHNLDRAYGFPDAQLRIVARAARAPE